MPSTGPKTRSTSDSAGANAPQPVERIVLTGFMGSGKSTVGRRLAQRLGWRFIDLDSLIEQRDGRAVSRIFAESGEAAFRAVETEALTSSLSEPRLVLALGGGALETPANRHALGAASQTCTVLLTASFETLYDRCQQQIVAAAALLACPCVHCLATAKLPQPVSRAAKPTTARPPTLSSTQPASGLRRASMRYSHC